MRAESCPETDAWCVLRLILLIAPFVAEKRIMRFPGFSFFSLMGKQENASCRGRMLLALTENILDLLAETEAKTLCKLHGVGLLLTSLWRIHPAERH